MADLTWSRARAVILGICLFTVPALAGGETPADSPNSDLHGRLQTVQGVPVLRVWGTARQRGFAHGYLLANEIRQLLLDYLDQKNISGGPEAYEKLSLPAARTLLAVRPIHQREMAGIAEGVVARLGREGAMLPPLKRPIEYADILAFNAASDWLQPMCASFSAWGERTPDGGTITGRNLDWHRIRGMVGSQIVLVQAPSEKPKRAGWVGVTWPGFVGCLTGMSEAGVTVAIHDVPRMKPAQPFGLTARGLALREVIERVSGPTAIADAAALLRERRSAMGTNVMISRPFDADAPGDVAAVLEYDGQTDNGAGVTPRSAESFGGSSACAIVCTNHYRARRPASRCDRYALLEKSLGRSEGEQNRLTVANAWEMLDAVGQPFHDGGEDILTYHAVVFEPNARRLHVAFTEKGRSATQGKRVTFELGELLRTTGETARAAR